MFGGGAGLGALAFLIFLPVLLKRDPPITEPID